ncbi:hypothetical protein CLAIMM_11727 [Cladophialophora immunda]|nr:hypothetical protein CLAIMM_11727 [Cladophialophora immunda]
MLNQFPLEVLVHVLSFLECEDLQAVRLVNRALSSKAGPVLFRTVCVSCLTLDRLHNISRHPTLCLAVEELQYQEFNFDLVVDDQRSWTVEDRPTWRKRRMQYLTRTIAEFIAMSRQGMQSSEGDPDVVYLPSGVTLVDVEQEASEDEIQAMIQAVKELYAENARLQSPQRLYEAFCEAFPHLPNLHRVICVEADAGCTALDSSRIERTGALQRLRNVFPLPDRALRSCLQPDTRDWPSHGFMGVWRALSDQDSNTGGIRHLEIRRGSDLFVKRGIYLHPPESKDNVLVNGFQNLTVLSLCLEVDMSSPGVAVPQAAILAEALARASQLRRLEICLTSPWVLRSPVSDWTIQNSHWGIPFGDRDVSRENILPFVAFPELHTVVFEEVDFTSEQICAWLFMQPKLRHLVLRRPYLRGRWQDLVQTWWETPEFYLDSFELISPWDHDNRDFEESTPRRETAQVPSRVSSDAILDFINHGGRNPFDGRIWRPFYASEGARGDGAEDDNLSNYSDLSEWVPEDHPTPVEDPEGPEFDEDYDFDAEEDSDIEMEESSSVG